LDKNFGSTFIIWDRIFGTFVAEVEKPVYGITTPINTYNPITLNFHEWRDIVVDVRKSRSFKEAYAMMFTRPSKLKIVKSEFDSVHLKEYELLNKTNVDVIKNNNIKKSKQVEPSIKDGIVKKEKTVA
jgi:hypothetical protein